MLSLIQCFAAIAKSIRENTSLLFILLRCSYCSMKGGSLKWCQYNWCQFKKVPLKKVTQLKINHLEWFRGYFGEIYITSVKLILIFNQTFLGN